jgi:hypothetical protein
MEYTEFSAILYSLDTGRPVKYDEVVGEIWFGDPDLAPKNERVFGPQTDDK